MKNAVFLLTVLLSIGGLGCADVSDTTTKDPGLVTEALGAGHPLFEIRSFVATQVYSDNPYTTDKENAKFVVVLNDGPGEQQPADVESVEIHGPHGFDYAILNQQFGQATQFNGWIRDPNSGSLWWQGFVGHYLEDGNYKVTVNFADGSKTKAQRKLESNFELLDFYLAHKASITYAPSGVAAPRAGLAFSWTTLSSLGGPNGYYNWWTSPGYVGFVDAQTALQGQIFLRAKTDPTVGFNMASDPVPGMTVGPQTWFTEILDSNVLSNINMAIFQPPQYFYAY